MISTVYDLHGTATVDEWRAIRGSWRRLHVTRVALDVTAFTALIVALLPQP